MSNPWVWIRQAIAASVAVVVAVWSALPFMLHLLIYLMAADILSGLIAAGVERKVSSQISFVGLARKGMILLLVGIAQLLGMAVEIPQLAVAAAGFYCVHEGLSIIENAVRIGVPVPAVIRESLARLSPEKMGPVEGDWREVG